MHLHLLKCPFWSTRFLLNLLGNWRECVWTAVQSISLRLDRRRTNLRFIKLKFCAAVLFDSWAANNRKHSDEKDKEERKSNFLSLFKAHLKFGMKELILDSLLIPLDSQMKNVFEILKGSLEIHSKLNSMSCENIISGKHWRGKFHKDNEVKNKTFRIPNHNEKRSGVIHNSQFPNCQSYRTTTQNPQNGQAYVPVTTSIKSDNTDNKFRLFFPLKFTGPDQKQPWSSLCTCMF